jgi:hypothetical protein
MRFPFEWIPGGNCRQEPAQVLALEMDQNLISPALSVQPEWNKGLGIIRGTVDRLTGDLIEDHIFERLGSNGELINTEIPIVGADKMREGVWTVNDHISRYHKAHPDHLIAGWVGNGNLLSNPHFVAFVSCGDRTQLFHLKSEEKYLGNRSGSREYSCLVVRKKEFAKIRPSVSIENLRFWYENGRPQVYSLDDNHIVTEEIAYATFGQRLITKGRTIDRDELCQMAADEQFYDLRHLLLFGRLSRGEKRWIDIGLSAFWDENGNLNKRDLIRSLKGEVISVNIKRFPDKEVVKALADKGYIPNASPCHPGDFRIRDGSLDIIFRDGIYPHNMIGIREDGKLLSVVIRGLSNRVGVSVPGAAEIMEMLGAYDAIMIDNGGDVMMGYGSDIVLGATEGERNRLRGMILFVSDKCFKEDIFPNHFRMLVFPKQHYGV